GGMGVGGGAARRAALERGGPRGSFGAPAARRLRSWATAARAALVISRRTWKVQTWWGTSPKTAAIASGYRAEPSVVMPRTASPRGSSAARKRRKQASRSLAVGAPLRTW